ncbi:MAG: nitroreductase [Oscillospiraceae bacterium]|jgi:nitroreductase|nr:nitroreductase [Oscillospiraceae bacterium]
MAKIQDAITERYSCRDFTGEPLKEDQLKTLAEAALASPSAMNLQPWHITIVTDKALLEELDAVGVKEIEAQDKDWYAQVMQRGGTIFYNAPCMVMVSSNGSDPAAMDCGIVSQNVSLAAHALGLGSVICGMARLPLSGSRKEDFEKKLQFPDGYHFGIAILVGEAKTEREPHKLDWGKVSYVP